MPRPVEESARAAAEEFLSYNSSFSIRQSFANWKKYTRRSVLAARKGIAWYFPWIETREHIETTPVLRENKQRC